MAVVPTVPPFPATHDGTDPPVFFEPAAAADPHYHLMDIRREDGQLLATR